MSATTVQTESGFHNVRAGDAVNELKKAESISFKNLVDEVRSTFKTGKTKDLNWRKQQLKQIQKCFAENHERITEAIRKDHGGPKFRGVFDMNAVSDMNLFLKNIDRWAADEKVAHDSLLGKSYIRKEPKGVVLLIAPWNFPFAMVFDVLVPILGAGNCVIIKPSEVSENSCNLIAELIPKYFDNSAVKVVTGGVSETTALLREKFDHIMYTGNGAVGRIVMAAAAKNLTPVTLELGGKSPVYVDKSAKVKMAVARVAQFKWMNVGQICIAPDYVLVHEDVADEFKTGIVQILKKNFGATLEERKKNPDYARIINSRHVGRLDSALKNTRGKILIGGGNHPEDNFFDATIIEDPHIEDAILKEEIFGPLLPILTVKGVEEAAQKVNQICDKPLALYIFAQKQSVIDYFLNHTNSGGVAVNTTLEHITNPSLPFGGVGESGMGHYHGKWGFDEFTHIRSVYVKDSTFSTGPSIPQPPYGDTLYNLAIKMNITGFLTDSQRLALKIAGVGAVAAAGYALVSRSKL